MLPKKFLRTKNMTKNVTKKLQQKLDIFKKQSFSFLTCIQYKLKNKLIND
jgi:hypothetical protein